MWNSNDLTETCITLGRGAALPRALLAVALVVAALSIAPDAAARAACSCGFANGQFTLTTITIDGTSSGGDLTGWDAVLGDTDNNVCDAEGSNNGESAPHPDRDWLVQSTGRDLTWFAFTWDANYVYFFTQRLTTGSNNNIQRFVYYADEDGDGLMETGETAIGVEWQGNTRAVTLYQFTYNPSAGGGDPMVDGGGFADGYTLPGTLTSVRTLNSAPRNFSGNFGSSSGYEMEFRVSWDVVTGDDDGTLEVSDGPSAVAFHVSSQNSAFGANNPPNQVDDNMAGCGGGGGSTQFAAVDITPDRSVTVTHSTTHPQNVTTCLAHTVTNNGNDDDVFNITNSALPSGITSVTFYRDVNTNGTYESGTDTLLADEPEPETPTSIPALDNSDTTIDTDVLAAAAVRNILACYVVALTNSYTPTAGNLVVTLTATSAFEPLVTDSVTDTITIATIADPAVVKSSTVVTDPINGGSNAKRIPGSFVDYTIAITNNGGSAIDSNTTVISDLIPAGTELFVNTLGGTPAGPVDQDPGSVACGLVAASLTVLYSKTVGVLTTDPDTSYAATVTPDGNGVDAAVTAIRIKPSGTFAAQSAPTAPSCTWRYRVRVE